MASAHSSPLCSVTVTNVNQQLWLIAALVLLFTFLFGHCSGSVLYGEASIVPSKESDEVWRYLWKYDIDTG